MADTLKTVRQPKFCYDSAQHEFIKSVRASVLVEGANYFKKKDWKQIGPSSNTSLALTELKTCADSFHVQDVAMWVPHLLLPDHVPSCPHCKQISGVDLSKAEFVERPKSLLNGPKFCMAFGVIDILT